MDRENPDPRRAYKTAWQREKRAKVKADRGEEVTLFLPRKLSRDLRATKPKGLALNQWLVAELRHKVATKTAPPEVPQQPVANAEASSL
ncbi:MAG: hypothetical protein IAE97_04140 [Chthoniobacterales bacterium]|nr:hypothetical protein [Chthoniobacterales bacterium]